MLTPLPPFLTCWAACSDEGPVRISEAFLFCFSLGVSPLKVSRIFLIFVPCEWEDVTNIKYM